MAANTVSTLLSQTHILKNNLWTLPFFFLSNLLGLQMTIIQIHIFQLMDLSSRHSRHLGEAMWLLSDVSNSLALNQSTKHMCTYSHNLHHSHIQMHEYRPHRKAHKYPRSKLFRYVLGLRIM